MSCRIPPCVLAALAFCTAARAGELTFACDERNDLYQAVVNGGARPPRFDSPGEAVAHARPGSAVLVLADHYPTERVRLDGPTLNAVKANRLRLNVEHPQSFPGVEWGDRRTPGLVRVAVASDQLPAVRAEMSLNTGAPARAKER